MFVINSATRSLPSDRVDGAGPVDVDAPLAQSVVPLANVPASLAPRLLYGLLAVAFLTRLVTLGLYPLTDKTEARYAEIARKMIDTGQWLVPQIDYGVPFWGKPPLSMWLTALSYHVFGVNAFAARLPSLLLALAVCFLAYHLGTRQKNRDYGLRASIVVATSLLMLVSAGGVMTDPAMVLGTTLSMVSYWLAVTTSSWRWGYLFFVGLAIGLLAKGPVAALLTALPVGVWAMLTGRMSERLRRLPWLRGSVLLTVLVVPWYLAAESHSPGFLRYFIVGEHLQRFLVPGWKGDLYGVGHAYPRGTIWLFAFLGTLPWSPWLIWQLLRHGAARALAPLRGSDGWVLYLVCWMLAPVVFFTFSRNILPTYCLPGLIGFGLLVAQAWQAQSARAAARRTGWLALLTPALAVVLLAVWAPSGHQSQQEIVAAYSQASAGDGALVYFRQRPYSAEFYSRGTAARAEDADAVRAQLARVPHSYVVSEVAALELLPPDLRAELDQVAVSRTGEYVLLRHLDRTTGLRTAEILPGISGGSVDAGNRRPEHTQRLRTSRE